MNTPDDLLAAVTQVRLSLKAARFLASNLDTAAGGSHAALNHDMQKLGEALNALNATEEDVMELGGAIWNRMREIDPSLRDLPGQDAEADRDRDGGHVDF